VRRSDEKRDYLEFDDLGYDRISLVVAVREKKCRSCKEPFTPQRPLQTCCSFSCALLHASDQNVKKAAKAEKERRKEFRERKKALKTRGDWLREAQAAFNAFIRARDKGQPCISCQRLHTGQMHAGHYRSVGAAPELRFEEDNVQVQCAPCNNHLSGNAIEYRINLVRKLGVERVEWLEGPHEPKKYSIEDIKEIKAKYKALARKAPKEIGW